MNVNYILIMKIRHKGVNFLTLENQERFFLEGYKSDDKLKYIHNFILERIGEFIEEYQFKWSDIETIQLCFRELLYLSTKPETISKEYKKLMNNQTYQDIVNNKKIFNPTLEVDFREIQTTIENSKIIKLDLSFLDRSIDFLENIEWRNKNLINNNLINKNKVINIHEKIYISTFGLKIINNKIIIMNNKIIIIKIIHIS